MIERVRTHRIHGAYRDIIYFGGARYDYSEWSENQIQDTGQVLLAGLLAGLLMVGGTYMAAGSGSAAWDDLWPVGPTLPASTTRLLAELGRVALTAWTYLNDDGSVSEVPTHVVQSMAVFGANDANGTWREFGIFGGPTASAGANTGLMFNWKAHVAVTKAPEIVSWTRLVKFTFD